MTPEERQILAYLRSLARTAAADKRGCYLYAAEEIERGEHRKPA